VCSDAAVYECSALYHAAPGIVDHLWSPNIRHVTGELRCSAIDQMARDAANGQLSPANPFLCVDSNRRAGMVKDHPFTRALFSEGHRMLEIVLNRVQDARDEELLDGGSAKDFFSSLSSIIEDILPPESALYTWRSKKDHRNLAAASAAAQNVKLDETFLGFSWEEIQRLTRDKVLRPEAGPGKPARSSFQISFTDSADMKTPYQILYMPGRVSLKINARDAGISTYLRVADGKVDFVCPGKALVVIGNLVAEAAATMMVRRRIIDGKTGTLTMDSFNEYLTSVNEARPRLAARINDHVLSGIAAIKPGAPAKWARNQ